ncbi:MAG: hypothetical protein HC770_06265 [Pseudanabaena sp. CRU_2_10]|nr:hypothetical protein [Pseudanabaena sp. CRU_2_10]
MTSCRWQTGTTAVRRSAKKDTGLHRVQTMLGRHRSLPGYGKGKSRLEEGRASRAAINTPIQGSAADVVAAAMVRIHFDPVFKQLGWTMLLQVHDEVRANASSMFACMVLLLGQPAVHGIHVAAVACTPPACCQHWWYCYVQVIMEGPEESAEQARARLVKCMREPFIKTELVCTR